MTHNDQIAFVREMSANIAEEIVRAILADKVPAEWDGHELRCLLATKHHESAAMSLLVREPQRKRARDYRNAVLVNNL